MTDHKDFMRQALELAGEADREGDMGVGALIVRDGEIVGRGRNRIRTGAIPSAMPRPRRSPMPAARLASTPSRAARSTPPWSPARCAPARS